MDSASTKLAVITRDKVFAFEEFTKQQPQTELKIVHHFGHRTYARELHIPKDTYLTGAIQKYANVNILSKGSMNVLTKNGIMEHVQAPYTEVTPVGTKRVGKALEDCVWTTIFATELTDPEEIVEFFTTNSVQEYLAFIESLKLERK